MTIFDWVLLGPVDAMLAVAAVIAARAGRRLRTDRLTQACPPVPVRVGRHRVGVAPGTSAQRDAAAVLARPAAWPGSAQARMWSISARARRAGRPPQQPCKPLIRPPVWVGAMS